MLEKLKLVEARYLEMAERAAQPDFYNDPKAASQLLKEQRQLEPIITAYRSYRKTMQEQDDLRAMLSEGLDPDMKALCQEEFSANKKKLEELEQELKILLLPRDPNDDKSVIMEIRGGVGGEESALFAHSLYRMYTMYAESKRWTVTLLNYNETELGGAKEADFEIQGTGAYSRLKFESGVHRVQRVPETESGGRVHTSTATVAVLPEMEQAEVDICLLYTSLNEVIRFNACDAPTKQAAFAQYKYPNAACRYAKVANYLGLGGNTDAEKVELLIKAIEELQAKVNMPKTIKEAGVNEEAFYAKLDEMVEQAFDDQCTGANPRYPLMSEIKEMYINSFDVKATETKEVKKNKKK